MHGKPNLSIEKHREDMLKYGTDGKVEVLWFNMAYTYPCGGSDLMLFLAQFWQFWTLCIPYGRRVDMGYTYILAALW